MWSYIFLSLEFLSAMAASIYFYKYGRTFLKYIAYYLWYVVIFEAAVIFYLDHALVNTDFIFNIWQIILFILIHWIVYNSLTTKRVIQVVHLLFASYYIVQIYEGITKNFISDYLPISYFYGGVISIISILFFAVELLKSQDIKIIKRDLAVWFLFANLVFWIAYLPIFFVFTNYTELSAYVISVLSKIQNMFIVVQNILFIVGFAWSEERV